MHNRHPLDPLTFDEIALACNVLKTTKDLKDWHRFVYVMNEEPHQNDILNLYQHPFLDRIAFICILDSKHNETFEARVSLKSKTLLEWTKLPFDKYPYGQAPILPSEVEKCEKIVKADPAWRAAMKKRNLNDAQIDSIQVDSFSTGYFEDEKAKGRRLVRATCYYLDEFTDNGYARPIEGVIALVDLTKGEIIKLEDDNKKTPIPKQKHNFDRQSITSTRKPLAPLDIIQPEGPGFKVNGWHVEWQDWKFRIGFNQREGLVLNTVSFHDQGRDRSILHRASVTEMVVPYADPDLSHFFKTAFDAGENGLGRFANQLELGCDCVGQIHYFDVPAADEEGKPFLMKHAICMHEEDAGPIAKHDDRRAGIIETRRARELVISFGTTIDNYDYVFYWRLCLDGTIKLQIKLTGIVQTAAILPGAAYLWGGKLTAELAAPMHQHLFNVRLHMSVDGPNNAVSESEFAPIPMGTINNSRGVAFGLNKIELATECARDANAATQRTWNVYNPSFNNAIGQSTAYKIEIPQTPLLLADPNSSIYKRAGFATKSLWLTRYDPKQKYAPGNYPNQHAGGDGLPAYIQGQRPIHNEPLVVWPVIGATHFPRVEDFPLMPAAEVGFHLKPFGFFNKSPIVDLAPDKNHKSVKQANEECCCGDNRPKACL